MHAAFELDGRRTRRRRAHGRVRAERAGAGLRRPPRGPRGVAPGARRPPRTRRTRTTLLSPTAASDEAVRWAGARLARAGEVRDVAPRVRRACGQRRARRCRGLLVGRRRARARRLVGAIRGGRSGTGGDGARARRARAQRARDARVRAPRRPHAHDPARQTARRPALRQVERPRRQVRARRVARAVHAPRGARGVRPDGRARRPQGLPHLPATSTASTTGTRSVYLVTDARGDLGARPRRGEPALGADRRPPRRSRSGRATASSSPGSIAPGPSARRSATARGASWTTRWRSTPPSRDAPRAPSAERAQPVLIDEVDQRLRQPHVALHA